MSHSAQNNFASDISGGKVGNQLPPSGKPP